MPIITELHLYPIKSCAGIALQEAQLTEAGLSSQLVYDREWMVVGPDGVAITQRTHPQMALIRPRIKGDVLEVRAPGMLALEIALDLPDPTSTPRLDTSVWDNPVLAFDCGELCATWFSKAIGVPCRLARFHSEATRYASAKWTGDHAAPVMFADGYPLLLIGQSSLDHANQKIQAAGREPVPMNRFRPNLVIADCAPFEEDYSASLMSDDIEIKPVKPCSRCTFTAVDQATGIPGPNPLDILQSFRADPRLDGEVTFGMNCIVAKGAGQTLFVGQTLDAQLNF
jgi:uncharacterized protein YcbX